MLLNSVKKGFRNIVEVCLWIILIGCAITGCVIGYGIDWSEREIYAFVGLLIGGLIGALVDVILGGFMATIIEMGHDIGEVKTKLSNIEARVDLVRADLARVKESSAGTFAVFQKMGNRGGSGTQPPTQ